MPIFLIVFTAAALLGVLFGFIGLPILVPAVCGRRPYGVVLHAAALALLGVAGVLFWWAWMMTEVRLPPGG